AVRSLGHRAHRDPADRTGETRASAKDWVGARPNRQIPNEKVSGPRPRRDYVAHLSAAQAEVLESVRRPQWA
ncbi:MAG: hypothetical protein ACRDTD_28725, partial [Pseudonocardiaceae bacterium]